MFHREDARGKGTRAPRITLHSSFYRNGTDTETSRGLFSACVPGAGLKQIHEHVIGHGGGHGLLQGQRIPVLEAENVSALWLSSFVLAFVVHRDAGRTNTSVLTGYNLPWQWPCTYSCFPGRKSGISSRSRRNNTTKKGCFGCCCH